MSRSRNKDGKPRKVRCDKGKSRSPYKTSGNKNKNNNNKKPKKTPALGVRG